MESLDQIVFAILTCDVYVWMFENEQMLFWLTEKTMIRMFGWKIQKVCVCVCLCACICACQKY